MTDPDETPEPPESKPAPKKCAHAWGVIPKGIVMKDGARYVCIFCKATVKRLPR